MKAVELNAFQIGVAILTIIASQHQSQGVRQYHGYKVIRVTPSTEDHVRSLRELLQGRNDVDVWKESSIPGEDVHIHLGPDSTEDFKADLNKRNLEFDTMIEDTQALIDNEFLCCSNYTADGSEDNFDNCYRTVDEIHRELFRLKKEYPDSVKLINLGKSYEKRNMLGIEIKQKSSGANVKGLIFIVWGIHAREWISPATGMYVVRQLLKSKDSDEGVADMLNTFNWFFLPVYNVDGYDYTHEVDRLWRKNRRPIRFLGSEVAIGVDLNRNFPTENWGLGECFHKPTCESYPGKKALSEVETQNVVGYLASRVSEVVSFFDIHSYSQMWLSPWGNRNSTPPEYSQMKRVMKTGVEAIKSQSGKVYKFGPTYSTIYPAYGITVDYVYGTLGVTHSYSLELRPSDEEKNEDDRGFFVPACEITDSGREIMAAFKAITPVLAAVTERKLS